ncbi:MAG: prepilin-type N-terminal cleavage/methylation domain-containing protein [bacterium]|nr:prepilin-type N-terminal cleavage/methylation domain-containing protein [bacterium]
MNRKTCTERFILSGVEGNRNGFILLEIILVIAVIALIGGGAYFKGLQNNETQIQTGIDVGKKAEETIHQLNEQNLKQQNAIDRLKNSTTSSPDQKPVLE